MRIKPLVIKYLDELPTKRTITEFPTGIERLDHKVWFSRKNINIIAGRPSNNKSSFILNCLAVPTAESGKLVVIFSLEDRKDRYTERYLANKTSIINYKIQHNSLTEMEQELLQNHKKTMDALPLEIIEDVGYRAEEIEKWLKESKETPEIIIIDYLNKIITNNSNRIETINDYLRKFSALSKQYNFCGVVCCQVNREAMGEGNKKEKVMPPMLHHIKESGDIEQIADVVVMLHWKYKYSNAEIDKNSFQLFISKNKDGESGVVNCSIEPEFNRIGNATVATAIDPFESSL